MLYLDFKPSSVRSSQTVSLIFNLCSSAWAENLHAFIICRLILLPLEFTLASYVLIHKEFDFSNFWGPYQIVSLTKPE